MRYTFAVSLVFLLGEFQQLMNLLALRLMAQFARADINSQSEKFQMKIAD